MSRRAYLGLALVRIYFAFCPSYLHPDEAFQGPEVFAGRLFPYPSVKTWEWTSAQPIRSVFPLWPLFGFPMTLLKWLWADEHDLVSPQAIYYTLRVVMFVLSFVLVDWAIYELVHSPRRQRQAIVLVASSYVTWTFQAHTFSNSLETILVLWSLVLMERLHQQKNHFSVLSSMILSLLIVLGTFNRITFPAFILIPGLRLVPQLLRTPLPLLCIAFFGIAFTLLAIATDTAFHNPLASTSLRALVSTMLTRPVVTPLNSLIYNTDTDNLALHGVHPHYQHLLVNIPQFMGPALFVLLSPSRLFSLLSNTRFISAISGTLILSIFPHQEARFLLPVIPLLMSCIPPLPSSKNVMRLFWATWIPFNIILGVLMGVYHQGGIVPAQLAIPNIITALNTNGTILGSDISFTDSVHNDAFNRGISHATVFWWKTYPPPEYLLGSGAWDPHTDASVDINTTTLMGASVPKLETILQDSLVDCNYIEPSTRSIKSTGDKKPSLQATFLVFPYSATPVLTNTSVELIPSTPSSLETEVKTSGSKLTYSPLWFHRQHVNLDDIEIPDDGVVGTVKRVFGMRGLVVARVVKDCAL